MSEMALIGSFVAFLALLPLVLKWQLQFRPVLLGLALLGGAAWVVVSLADDALGISGAEQAFLAAAFVLIGAFLILAYRFYRDPDREPPVGDHLVLSPADGTVVYVRRCRDGRLPVSTKHGRDVALQELTRTEVHSGDAVVVGIAMNFLDVHVNRAPLSGQIELLEHFAGRFGSLRKPEMVFENERATTVISGSELQVVVVQIASRLVRQIVTFVRKGQMVSAGQRIGAIRFGSQVDLVLPLDPSLHVLVNPGDRVQAGTSVIAMLESDLVPARGMSRQSVSSGDRF